MRWLTKLLGLPWSLCRTCGTGMTARQTEEGEGYCGSCWATQEVLRDPGFRQRILGEEPRP